ncbi:MULTISPECIES: hypothetical protein [Actinomadura]|jgi:hypothetical protein|uniref:Uncharacterized protein n=1 Tax=Actinomadura geliboluensis TaxID=882440 RepID=A0A5S4GW22_9ACTN|nr:hypothetical protein [Actinomadura geliboluensis]TMR37153.1 hypothetical protein ETD96_19125 [Actinomadura geliboluensis]
MTALVALWILVPAALFLTLVLYTVGIGLRTRNADLRGEAAAAGADGRAPRLVTVRGLDGPRT